MQNKVYPKNELYTDNTQRSYRDDATEAKFLLGGIGTGNVSVGSRGQFCDWELFNKPGKGNKLPNTFFSLWTQDADGKPITKVLESRLKKPHERLGGYDSPENAGLPRFDKAVMKGEYPFVNVELIDHHLPLSVTLEAFTPFIPLNAAESGIPGAVIRYRVKNNADMEKNVSIAFALANVVGFNGYHDPFTYLVLEETVKNELRIADGINGLYYTSPGLSTSHMSYGSMAITTSSKNFTTKPEWAVSPWFDGITDFWNDFSEDGRLQEPRKMGHADGILDPNNVKVRIGGLALHETIPAGGEHVFEFILTWHFPNRPKHWWANQKPCCEGSCEPTLEANFYSTLFKDAWDTAAYLSNNLARLEKSSRDFHRALFGSTLPGYVIDALSTNITIIRSTTCFRLRDGTFLGWEGCYSNHGCCDGNCTHVWNYTQAVAFLFPELEHSMRRTEFLLETDNSGNMAFRAQQVFGLSNSEKMPPATDGQMGTIVRLYRDWKFSGNDMLLRQVWEKASLALDFAFEYWDKDGDYVLDSKQHNTYDIEFYGPNSLSNSIFFAALKAGAEMAAYLGDTAHELKYREALAKGSQKMDEMLWSGEYYVQAIDDVDQYLYQYGKGCLSDQLLGQQLAHVAGLGYILPKEHVKKAISSIFKYNFLTDMSKHPNVQRTFAINDEKGLLLCSWPHGGRPYYPFTYSDEVWPGIEYQVAAHLIHEGYVDEGLTIVKAVRERFDGYNRNPWNEVECGNHYARSLAVWAVLVELSGYKFDMTKKEISFAPAIAKEDFSCFFSTGEGWGIYKQKIDDAGEVKWETELLYGTLDGMKVNGSV